MVLSTGVSVLNPYQMDSASACIDIRDGRE